MLLDTDICVRKESYEAAREMPRYLATLPLMFFVTLCRTKNVAKTLIVTFNILQNKIASYSD